MLLEGRRLLVTGVLTESSIAFSIARRAQEEGAELVLTGFGRGLRITQRVARRLPTEPDVLELDVNDPEQLEAVAGELDGRWGRLDGLVHAIAFVPGDALGGNFLTAPSASAIAAFETSAFSLKALAAAMLPLLERAEAPGGAIVGLDFDAQVAWPAYDWAGVSRNAPPSASAGAKAIAWRIPSSAPQRCSMSLTTAAMWSGSLTSSSRTSGGSGRRLAIRVVIRIPRPKPVSTICAPSSCARLATA